MTNEEYIAKHRTDDVRALALKKAPEGIDAPWCLQQIEGWQLACKKLPKWSAADDLWFPPRISMEQCSSEATALYKRGVVERLVGETERLLLADFTGGFGIDFSYMAQAFRKAVYVEQQSHLCDIARHNFPLLGLHHAVVVNEQAPVSLAKVLGEAVCERSQTVIYLDPARRDDVGRKVVALEDCTPNVIALQDVLAESARFVILKLSPMLDITQAVRQLRNVVEVHVLSVQGECKEVLLVLDNENQNENQNQKENQSRNQKENPSPSSTKGHLTASAPPAPTAPVPAAPALTGPVPAASVPTASVPTASVPTAPVPTASVPTAPALTGPVPAASTSTAPALTAPAPAAHLITYYCSDIRSTSENGVLADTFVVNKSANRPSLPIWNSQEDVHFLYEPNASILKAGVQDYLCEKYAVQKLHPMSNLFVSFDKVEGFAGRTFAIEHIGDFSKSGIKETLSGISKANLTVRNFPATVADLRKKLKLKEGGDSYLFATTLCDGRHAFIRTRKA